MSRWSWRSSVLCLTFLAAASYARAQDSAAEDEASPLPAAEAVPWSLQLSAEAGVGTRNVDLPRDGVIYQVRSGVYPALGVGFQLDYHGGEPFSIGLVARYQTSIGLMLNEQLTDFTTHARKTRSHVFEVGIAPTFRIGSAGWAIGGALGYSVTELDPQNHLETPSYHLGGLHGRLALQAPLGTEQVRLVVSGEGQATLQVGDELTARGVSARGWGAGGGAAFELGLSERWTVAISYRELHYWLGSQQGASFVDALRFVTAQLRGRL